MVYKLFSLLILSAALAHSELIPAARLVDWEPGVDVGVPGGIDQYRPGGASERTTLIDVTQAPYNADNTGVSNASTAVSNAVAAATSGQVVYLPAGTYRFNSMLYLNYKDNITIRGAGVTSTIIDYRGTSDPAIKVGGDGTDYLWNYPNLTITGSPTRGTSVLSIADTTNVTVGMIAHITMPNSTSAAVPVVSTFGFDHVRKQKTMVTAKTASTITISPALYFDLSSGAKLQQATVQSEFVGVEDLTVNLANSSSGHPGVAIYQGYACWLYNVKVTNVPNYNFGVADSVKCEVRKCQGIARQSEGTNGAALLVGAAGACLFEDNIFGSNFPSIEVNGGTSGSVFAYNFTYDSAVFGASGCSINTNHAPHNSYNLYEGNITPNFQSDGYFGGESEATFFRNWAHGVADTGIRGLCFNFNRFSRNFSVVGNVIGSNDSTSFPYPDGVIARWGMPNIGNFSWTGEAQPSLGDWWADFGTSPGPSGFQELDLDVEATLSLKGNYNTETDAQESLGGDTLPSSLFRDSKPTWFGNLAWPPIDPANPDNPVAGDADYARIPAGYRYVNGTDPPTSNNVSIQTLNVTNLTITGP